MSILFILGLVVLLLLLLIPLLQSLINIMVMTVCVCSSLPVWCAKVENLEEIAFLNQTGRGYRYSLSLFLSLPPSLQKRSSGRGNYYDYHIASFDLDWIG